MVAADAVRMVLMAVLGVLVLLGGESLPLLYVVALLFGVAETLFDHASQAIMPSLVPRDHLEKANARLYAAEIVTNQFAAPRSVGSCSPRWPGCPSSWTPGPSVRPWRWSCSSGGGSARSVLQAARP